MGSSFKKFLVKKYLDKPIDEILNTSSAALRGLSDTDAISLENSIGITTIRDMANNKFFIRSEALLSASGRPDYDPGPPPDWADFFKSAPNYMSKWTHRIRWEFGPIFYRGRLDGTARVIVIGQDPSTDEAIARRVFVGGSGQRVQGLLKKLGISSSYIMLNTFIYSIYGQFNNEMRTISEDPLVLDYRNEFLDRLIEQNNIEAVIAIGAAARHAVQNWSIPTGLHVSYLVHPSASPSQVTADWNQDLPILLNEIEPDLDGIQDHTPYGQQWAPEDRVPIPRKDLPFGVPEFLGTGGTRSQRDPPKKIIWEAP